MRNIFFFFFLFCGSIVIAQNLVPNPSFESYAVCPVGFSQFNGWINTWVNPSTASPDYYNACAGTNPATVPYNPTGYQQAYTGNAYVGIYTTGGTYREFVQVQLTAPLSAGVQYHFSMQVSLANKAQVATDDLGAYLSVNAPTSAGTGFLSGNPVPQISNAFGNVITDTLNWVPVTGNYTATGGEQYLTLGHFKPDAQCTYTPTGYGTIGAYYFIDEVSLIPNVSPLQITTNVNFANCFGVCNGSATVTATGGTPPYHYLWSGTNDTTAATDSLCAGGAYHVTVTDALGAAAVDSVFLPVIDPFPVTLNSNVSVMCAGDTAVVCAPSGYVSYLWNTGDTTLCTSVLQAGNYYVTVTNQNNCATESNHLGIIVHPLPPVFISVNGDTLSAYNAVTYQWYLNGNAITGATDSIYIANQGGSYTVAVTDTNGCNATSNAIVVTGIAATATAAAYFSLSPNPFTDEINITTATGATILLTDITGRAVPFSFGEGARRADEVAVQLQTASLSRGIYFLQITTGTGERIVKQIVKQ